MSDNFILLELIEKERLDEVLRGFTAITGISSFIVDPAGRPLSDEHNWSGLCSDYCRSTEEGKRRCYQSDRYGGEMSAKLKRRFIYPCLNAGLIDCTSPIIVGKVHIATFMCGQVLHGSIDEATAEKHAR
jgi:ligand-binding sensor protein